MTRTIFIAAALALVAILPAMPAQAAGRTFVSAAGSDSNPCTITLPCRNLQAAYNAVAANGQIDALDPGNYGSLTITGPVSIQGHGWAAMSANTGAAITINAAGAFDKIFISGVVLDGLGIVGTNGIQFNSGGSLHIQDSVIRNFGGNGVFVDPSALHRFSVSNTLVSDNGQAGIRILATGIETGVLDHVTMQNNGGAGLQVSSTQAVTLTLNECVVDRNLANGIQLDSASTVVVRNSTIANHFNAIALTPQATGAAIFLTRSTVTGNGSGVQVFNGGAVISYGDNNIFNNGSGNAATSTTGGYQ